MGVKPTGFCYYHTQDLERAVDKNIKNLYLGFDSVSQNDNEALQVANRIVTKLKETGFELDWNGSVDQRIEIKNINWQKIPDDENWGAERVISILATPDKSKKPFWKFW